jgi:hypothetical protein
MLRSRAPARRPKALVLIGASLAIALAAPVSASHGDDRKGFKTEQPRMLDPVAPGVKVKPIITVGEDAGVDGWFMDSLPDGIAINPARGGGDKVEIFLNHETSLVPFTGLNDLTNAQVSRITLNRETGGVLDGEFVIPSSQNFQRFCSNFIASREQGFDRPILFTNEEATDWVNRTGTAWPATQFGPGAEQAGVVVAYDVRSGEYKSIYGMGRHNHENSVAIPGYRDLVVLSGDDTFTAPASQLYSYIADDTDELLEDEGALFAFRSNNSAINDYGDLSGASWVSGEFIPVPRDIARGKDAAGNEITAPVDPPTGVIPGPQWALEYWSNQNNVFQFIRVEDIAYDRNNPRIVYFADTGEPRALPDSTTGRLRRGPSGTAGPWPNGRIFKMVLDRKNPRKVQSLSILVDGDALGAVGAGNVTLIHQPDNIETTERSLLIQEDPGSQNQYDLSNAAGTTARIWKYDFRTRSLTVVAKVNQAIDNAGLASVPAIPGVPNDTQTSIARQGGWESSGIVDASRWFGHGWFLVDIQAGTYVPYFEMIGGVRHEREGGQLLLVKIPGT